MSRNEVLAWMNIAAEAAALGLEAATVVGLRLSRAAAGGPNAAAESWRMCSEKAIALAELHALFLTGSLGHRPSTAANRALKHYRRKVTANRRRLSRS